MPSLETLDERKRELEDFREQKLAGVYIKSRARWVEEGENLHIIFVSYNQEIGLVKKIPRIKFDNVDFICKQSDILKSIKRYFENLYRNVNNSREEYDLHEDLNYQNIKKLSFEE